MRAVRTFLLLEVSLVFAICFLTPLYTNHFISSFLVFLYFLILISPVFIINHSEFIRSPLMFFILFNATFGFQLILPFVFVDSQLVDTIQFNQFYNTKSLVIKLLLLKIISLSVFYLFFFIRPLKLTSLSSAVKPAKIKWISIFLIVQGLLGFSQILSQAESLFELLIQRELARSDRIYQDIGRHWFVAVQLSLVGFYLLVLEKPKRSVNVLFNILFIAFVIMNFIISGNRTSIVLAYLGLYAAWILAEKRFINYVLIFMGCVFLILLLAGNVVRETGISKINIHEGSIREQLVGSLSTMIDIRVERSIEGSGSLGVLAHLENGGEHLFGESYKSVLYAPVPSAIIGEKPLAGGRMAAYILSGRLDTAWPIEPVVEQYWNYGFFGIFVAAIIQAIIFRKVDNLVHKNSHNVAVLLVSLVIGMQLQIASDTLYKVLQSIVPIFLIYLYTNVKLGKALNV